MKEKQKIEIADFLKFQYLSSPSFSPDGEQIAFVVTRIGEEQRYEGDVWLLDRKTGTARRLTEWGDVKSYFWTADRRLCFLTASKEGVTPCYEADLETGSIQLAFQIPLVVGTIRPCGEGRFLVTAVRTNQPHTEGYDVLEEAPFWGNGAGITSGQRKSLYLFEPGKEPVPISEPYTSVGNYQVRGNMAAYQAIPWRNYLEYPYSPAICLYNLETGEKRTVMEMGQFNNFEMAFWKDDELLLSGLKGVPGKGMGQNADFYTLNLTTGELKFFAAMDRVIGFGGTTTDAKYGSGVTSHLVGEDYYFVSPIDDGSYLNRIHKDGTIETKLDDDPAAHTADSVEGFDVFENHIVTCKMGRDGLAELYLDGKKVTSFNDGYLDSHDVRSPQFITFTARDRYEIHGWFMTPRGYEKGNKYPAILHIHGGPKNTFGDVYHHEMQVWANAGYFVLFCNPRGSDGRGTDFADINGKWGTVDYENLMDFTDEMLRRCPDIDRNRMAVCGGSYGGFMTNWIIGHTHRFAAACSQRSMANLIDFEYLSDIGHTSILSEHMTTAEEDPARLWKESPLKYAPNCTTPTLFIHSDEDYRCYMSDGLAMFACLKRHGCEARFCLFHGENHELSRSGRPQNRIRRMEEILNWFDQYLKK